MKFAIVTIALFFASAALSQEVKPQTMQEVSDQANGIIAALQAQRNQAYDQAALATAQVSKLTKELDAARAELTEAHKLAERKKDEPK